MKTRIALMSLVALMFSCSCKTVPVKPPMSPAHQALVKQVEDIRGELEKSLREDGTEATVTVNKVMFATSGHKPDVAIVVLESNNIRIGALFMETDKEGWKSLGEMYSGVDKLGPRRGALVGRAREFEAELTKSGSKFKHQETLWATVKVSSATDSALMFYEVDGVNVGFAAFFMEGGWVVIPETFE
jgi:hypothetical protein